MCVPEKLNKRTLSCERTFRFRHATARPNCCAHESFPSLCPEDAGSSALVDPAQLGARRLRADRQRRALVVRVRADATPSPVGVTTAVTRGKLLTGGAKLFGGELTAYVHGHDPAQVHGDLHELLDASPEAVYAVIARMMRHAGLPLWTTQQDDDDIDTDDTVEVSRVQIRVIRTRWEVTFFFIYDQGGDMRGSLHLVERTRQTTALTINLDCHRHGTSNTDKRVLKHGLPDKFPEQAAITGTVWGAH